MERGGRKKNREMLRAVGKGKEKEKGKRKEAALRGLLPVGLQLADRSAAGRLGCP